MLDRKEIERCVLRAVDRVNQVLLDQNALPKETGTILVGDGGHLDSMGFVNFVVSVEDELTENLNFTVNLADELSSAESEKSKPLTIGGLVDFLFVVAERQSA